MYPEGHARNTSGNLTELLEHKFRALAGAGRRRRRRALSPLHAAWPTRSAAEIAELYDFQIRGC